MHGGQALRRSDPSAAVELLQGVLVLQPANVEAVLALAPLLRGQGRAAEALQLLERAERDARGRTLRRVRWAIFRAAPGFRTGWRWLAGRSAPNPG